MTSFEMDAQRSLAALSHDLRQPLQALQINAAAMALRARRLGDPPLMRLADAVDQSVAHCQQLLDGLMAALHAAAPDTPPPVLQTLDLWPLLHGLQQAYAEPARQRGLRLDLVREPPADQGSHGPAAMWVRSDPALLQRLLANLVGNALKFTRQGAVQLRAGPVLAGRLRLQLQDSGPGLSPGEQALAFEPGYQGAPPAGDGAGDGQGLGLAIVKALALALGIGLVLRSTPGQGTCVELAVPLADPPAAPPAA